MAASEELNKLPTQFRPRSGAAVLNISTPEVHPNLGRLQRNSSAKKMLVNVQEEGAKTLGRKQRKAQLDNPVLDPSVDKRMLKRGIYSEVNDRSRSATFTPSSTSSQSRSTSALLPPVQDRRASLPYVHHDVTIQQPSVNGTPPFASHVPQSLDSGVVMDTVEPTQMRPQVLSSSLDDLTEQRSRTNSTQVQFPLSLTNNVMSSVATGQGCNSEHVLNKHGDCVVCDVLRSEPDANKSSLVNHLQKEKSVHSRDSGVGNELQLNILSNSDGHQLMEVLPSPSKGMGISRSVEIPSEELQSMDLRSPLKEKDFFETTNDLAKVSVLGTSVMRIVSQPFFLFLFVVAFVRHEKQKDMV